MSHHSPSNRVTRSHEPNTARSPYYPKALLFPAKKGTTFEMDRLKKP